MAEKGVWLIFEGPDGAGKSTAADATVRELADVWGPAVLQHLTSHSAFDEYYAPVRLWTGSGLNVVQDRCIVSDLVYAPVLRGVPSKFGESRVRAQMEAVAQRATVLHFTASLEALEERLNGRGDDLITDSMLADILEGYDREMSRWQREGARVITFDTTERFHAAKDILWDVFAHSIGDGA